MTHAEIDKVRRKRALEEANKVLDNTRHREPWDPFIGTIFLMAIMILVMSLLAV